MSSTPSDQAETQRDLDLAAAMVENLATQFKSALDFYRELVQNSIDAGTPRIDVWLEYQPGEGGEGAIVIHVDDFGDGMTEAIVDNELTQLFASSKDNDLTKIGKFGIGFVSVFALKPQAVIVTTGRSGEYWQIMFGEDRSFVKTRIEDPVEGTQVALFLEGDFQRYSNLVRDSLASLRKWCIYSETEITFEDRSASLRGEGSELVIVNRPFGVDGAFGTVSQESGTEIHVAFAKEPEWGFYNRGLTLLQTNIYDNALPAGHRKELGNVAVRIKSRYLEHTLTRETVLRDENYEKAIERVLEVVRGPLRQTLVTAMEELANGPSWGVSEMARYAAAAGFVAEWPAEAYKDWAERKIFRLHGGGVDSLRGVAETIWRDGRVHLSESLTEATSLLVADGVPVIVSFCPDAPVMPSTDSSGHPMLSGVHRILKRWMGFIERDPTTFRGWGALGREASDYVQALARAAWKLDGAGLNQEGWVSGRVRAMFASPERVLVLADMAATESPETLELLAAAHRVLDETRAGYRSVAPCRIPSATAPLFVVGKRIEHRMMLPPERGLARGRRPHVAVNVEHADFQRAMDVYGRSPAMAVYFLAKALLLEEDRLLHLDDQLIEAALELAAGTGAEQ